jgi:hypothetical protein
MTQLEQSTTTVGVNRSAPVIGGLVFLVGYLLVGPVAGALADRDLPLPDAAAGEVAGYYAAHRAAALVGAALQLASVAGLLLFAHAIGVGGRAAAASRVAVATMVLASLLTGALTVMAGDAADQSVALVREAGFYAGGVAHVVTLGLFSLLAASALHQRGLLGGGVRTFGYVAGALAVLSVLSVAIYFANALLPLGRVLCMVWTVTVGVSLWRSRR